MPLVPLVLLLLGTLFPPSPEAAEPKRTTPVRPQRSFVDDRSLITPPREAPDMYVIEDDGFRLEFMPEGWLYHFRQEEKFAGFWLMEISGAKGQTVWDADRGVLDFDMDDGQVRYHRTRAITEAYEADRYGVRQTWIVDENPLFEGGDVLIYGEILTSLDVRLVDGRIQLYDGSKRVGAFCSFEAQDPSGRTLDLVPEVDGRVVKLTLPSRWLYQIGNGDLSKR
jgi:hypothetical protein